MTSDIGRTVRNLWLAFQEAEVRACMARDFEYLPERVPGDLDIFVHPDDLLPAEKIVREVGSRYSWRVVFRERVWPHLLITLCHTDSDRWENPRFLTIDLQSRLGRKGFHYTDVEPFLDHREERHGVSVLAASAHATALALHCVLDKGRVSEERREVLTSGDTERIAAFAHSLLPSMVASYLVDWIASGCPAHEISGLSARLRRRLLVRHPLNLVRPALVQLKRWLRFFGKRRGALAAFVGPDGAGKTTIVDAVADAIPEGPFPVTRVYMGKKEPFLPSSRMIRQMHRRPNYFGALFRRMKSHTGQDSGPSSSSERARGGIAKGAGAVLLDIAGLINWTLDQWARYFVLILPVLQQDGIVLTDRYYFDFVSRGRNSIANNGTVARFLVNLFPTPDRTYLLWERPEILRSREPSFDEDELAETLDAYRRLNGLIPDGRQIRTNSDPKPVAREIATALCRTLVKSG